ncbi:hypothetical protein Tco_0812884, partial [Tanacetum coccineum]
PARISEESALGDLHLLRDGPADTGDDECVADENEQGDTLRLLRGDADDEEWNLLWFADDDVDECSTSFLLHRAMKTSCESGDGDLSDESLSEKSPDGSEESVNKNEEVMGAAGA